MARGISFAWVVAGSVAFGALVACGSGGIDGDNPNGGDSPDASTDGGPGITLDGAAASTIVSVEIFPPAATIVSKDGAPVSQTFNLIAHHADGTVAPIAGAPVWTSTTPQVGAMSGSTFNANGTVGGHVDVHASYKGLIAAAKLTVQLDFSKNTAAVDPKTADTLRGATAADSTTKWAYPYDGTVFPRGLAGPTMMWMGGAAPDVYRVAIQSDVFKYEDFVTAPPPAQASVPAPIWTAFVESTSGKSTLDVDRWDGKAATVVTHESWSIAPGSMRGTIYYWSNRQGRVMRISPGADAPEDFSAPSLGTAACTMTCHSVSADGSTLSSGGDSLGGTYDLLGNKPKYAIPGAPGSTRQWNFAALTPNGKGLVTNGNGAGGLYSTVDGSIISGSGLEGVPTWMPAFTPDGSSLLYVDLSGDADNQSLFARDFDTTKNVFGAAHKIVPTGAVPTLPVISYPSGTPDGQWAIYARSNNGSDTRGNPPGAYNNVSNLYLANLKTGAEIPLDALNGSTYPFAAGDRDRGWNYEPTFAPLASGGYFWVVFTSRRTYGNAKDDAHAVPSEMKQLWVAAIDTSPKPGTDPSHPAFRLPGQALTFADASGTTQSSLNMRGFWALEPCRTDTSACGTGSECCGGYCEDGRCKSAPPPCSADGDKCATSSDCCDHTLSCINHVCSLPGPK